jgi:hypothetical protein
MPLLLIIFELRHVAGGNAKAVELTPMFVKAILVEAMKR